MPHEPYSETFSEIDTIRRKLRFRAWHRGTKEADLIMGQFADANIETMDQEALAQFDAILDAQDLDVYNWVIGKEPVPAEYDNDLMKQIMAFDFRLPGSGF
jgi:antitoxin CptB